MNIYNEVQSLQKSPIEVGGLCQLLYFKKEDVLTWPVQDPLTGITTAAIEFKPGKGMFMCQSADKGRSVEEELKYGIPGPFTDTQVTAILGGNNTANIATLNAMKYHEWGLILKSRGGYYRLIGNSDFGARFTYKSDEGDNSSSRKVQLTWSWQNPSSARVYQSSLFTITIGTVTITTGKLGFIMRFRVGDPTAPMNESDTTLTSAGFANKNLLVLADGTGLPVDDGLGSIDWAPLINRHIEKTLAGDTITFIGGVVNKEIIEIYAFD